VEVDGWRLVAWTAISQGNYQLVFSETIDAWLKSHIVPVMVLCPAF
jgi:hypothetical protein